MSDNRYVVGGMDGWLKVKREPSGVVVALPEFTKVDVTSSQNGRDHFIVQEGVERGNPFSVIAGHLKAGNPGYRAPANLEFSLSRGLLTFLGGQVKAVTHTRNPIPAGLHPVQIPDFPHSLGEGYMAQSRYAKTWFYLGQGHAVRGNNDRYLHPGSVSAGCITVDPSMWTSLYQYLIRCRSGNAKTVGSVSVVR
ncbi:hypothetical protein LRS03_14615 [Rhizobacter sp. J219]|uniref:hypothetical protein n=1 Tax=Rhizobacter sp. J219 TaxID=2898430 RepID=UPI0021519815|nr:hypothetical protein [Rhizobacter sp. J219]MCR5884017.1 hypothetical protein [Rhizobacter sp. J219]